ncbi:amidohydrolase [Veillonella sp.]|uniref:amidohydrolase n=1 Tax=Veillonella sp. TaxID=1926307 RepID=UPI0025E38351|nr:amidohydrolase [Veillonella sp.]
MSTYKSIAFANDNRERFVTLRRDLHQHPEPGWLEYRTAAIAADRLTELGYDLKVGKEVIQPESRMGLPSEATMKAAMDRAIAEGANPKWVEAMGYGFTGLVATLHIDEEGPVVAFRADIDSNDVVEATTDDHLPAKEGFVSQHDKAMHACGHDAHLTMGLGLAEYIMSHKDKLHGTFKLILQPAEEGVRGAKAMRDAGVVDDVDIFFGMHIGINKAIANCLACMNYGFLATTKLDVEFKGYSSHAGASPELGKNALLAACTAALNLQAISRHSKGNSCINVGVLNAGTGRNVIPDRAYLQIETRGETGEINEYICKRAYEVLRGAAVMYDSEVDIKEMGSAPACINSEELAKEVQVLAKDMGLFRDVPLTNTGGGSEDCAYFLERVIANGGKATYMILGSDIKAPHHNPRFDIEEDDMINGIAVAGALVEKYLSNTK